MAVVSKKVKAMPIASQKPCQLQLNNSGAWKTVARFDAANLTDSDAVMDAAQSIQIVDGTARFRIATQEALPTVLMYLDSGEWREK